ncbi:YphA family membrane protein [Salibacterium sp. K-3]
MNAVVYFIILWYFWIIQTFFGSKNKYRLLSSIVVLCLIILFPFELQIQSVIVRPVALLLFFSGMFLLTGMEPGRRRKLLCLSGGFSFLFAAMRLAEWYEPVIFLFGHAFTYICVFSALLLLFGRSFRERVSMAAAICISGDFLAGIHLYPWTDSLVLGDPFLLNIVVCLLFLSHLYDTAAKGAVFLFQSRSSSFSNLPR